MKYGYKYFQLNNSCALNAIAAIYDHLIGADSIPKLSDLTRYFNFQFDGVKINKALQYLREKDFDVERIERFPTIIKSNQVVIVDEGNHLEVAISRGHLNGAKVYTTTTGDTFEFSGPTHFYIITKKND